MKHHGLAAHGCRARPLPAAPVSRNTPQIPANIICLLSSFFLLRCLPLMNRRCASFTSARTPAKSACVLIETFSRLSDRNFRIFLKPFDLRRLCVSARRESCPKADACYSQVKQVSELQTGTNNEGKRHNDTLSNGIGTREDQYPSKNASSERFQPPILKSG